MTEARPRAAVRTSLTVGRSCAPRHVRVGRSRISVTSLFAMILALVCSCGTPQSVQPNLGEPVVLRTTADATPTVSSPPNPGPSRPPSDPVTDAPSTQAPQPDQPHDPGVGATRVNPQPLAPAGQLDDDDDYYDDYYDIDDDDDDDDDDDGD